MRNLNRKTDWIDEWHNQTQFHTQVHGRRQPDPYRPERRQPELTVRNPGVRPEPPHFLREDSSPLGYNSHNRDNRERQRMAPRRLSKRKPSLMGSAMGNVGHWCNEELQFSMNKISIAGMVFGLMVLGTLFFVGGFLTAFIFYGSEPIMPAYVVAAPQTQQSWAMANNGVPTYQQQGGVPVTATGAYPQYSQGAQTQYAQPYPQQQMQQPAAHQNKYAKSAENQASYQVRNQANRGQERVIGGTAQKLTSSLPSFAQPLAQQVTADQTAAVHGSVNKNMDRSLNRGNSQPQMQQPQMQQQPYYQPQMQQPQMQQQMQPQQPMRQPQAQGGAWQQQNMAQPAYYPPQY